MAPNRAPILCLDFDGVIHSYKSGWKGAIEIPDPPVPGAIEFLREAIKHFDVAIYSSRSWYPNGIEAMREWLLRHSHDEMLVDAITFPIHKPPALVTLDDRAITFQGVFPSMATLLSFKPWYHSNATSEYEDTHRSAP